MHLFGHTLKKNGLIVLIAVFTAVAALTAEASVRTVKGDGGGSWNFTSDSTSSAVPQSTQAEEEQNGQNTGAVSVDVTAGPGAQTVYEFDGKRYVIDSDWGSHYLTGFSPNADGSRKTRSGAEARANYTVSSTLANLGKVILIRAEQGPGDFHRYDGVYKCEDTGGPAVETGKANTGNVPVIDIFFDTAGEAAYVSDAGWITARIYILREVD